MLIGVSQSFGAGAAILLWIIGIHALEAYVLNPKILGTAARIHPVVVAFALIAGERSYGLVGALFAVPQDGLLNVESIEFQRPQWSRYGTESDRISVGAGLGVAPIDQLSLGIGIHTLAAFTGTNTFTVHPMTSE